MVRRAPICTVAYRHSNMHMIIMLFAHMHWPPQPAQQSDIIGRLLTSIGRHDQMKSNAEYAAERYILTNMQFAQHSYNTVLRTAHVHLTSRARAQNAFVCLSIICDVVAGLCSDAIATSERLPNTSRHTHTHTHSSAHILLRCALVGCYTTSCPSSHRRRRRRGRRAHAAVFTSV